jgi:hypothetical protein
MQTGDNWVQKQLTPQIDVKPHAAQQPQWASHAPAAPPRSPQHQSAGQAPAAPPTSPQPQQTGQPQVGSQRTGQQARLAAAGSPTASASSCPKACVALAPYVKPTPPAPSTLPATSIRITLEVSDERSESDSGTAARHHVCPNNVIHEGTMARSKHTVCSLPCKRHRLQSCHLQPAACW